MIPPRRKRRLTPIAALALALALGSAGCGSGTGGQPLRRGASAARLLRRIERAARGAASVRVRGSIVGAVAPIYLNMELVPGRGGSGEIALGDERIDLLRLEQTLYVRGNRPFLEALVGRRAALELGRGWLSFPAYAGALAPLAELTNLGGMIDLTVSAHGALAPPRLARVGGEQAVAISDPAGGGTLYAAASGVPYPLEIVRSGRSSGVLRFDAWNKPVTITAPAHALHPEEPAPVRPSDPVPPSDIGPGARARARASARALRGEGEGTARAAPGRKWM